MDKYLQESSPARRARAPPPATKRAAAAPHDYELSVSKSHALLRSHTEACTSARRRSGSSACCGARRRCCRSKSAPGCWPGALPYSRCRASACAHQERVEGRRGAREWARAGEAATWLPPPEQQQPCPPPGRKTSPGAEQKTRGWPKPNRQAAGRRGAASGRAGREALEARRGRRECARWRGVWRWRRRCAWRARLWIVSIKSQQKAKKSGKK